MARYFCSFLAKSQKHIETTCGSQWLQVCPVQIRDLRRAFGCPNHGDEEPVSNVFHGILEVGGPLLFC